jgi:hypothetical protein
MQQVAERRRGEVDRFELGPDVRAAVAGGRQGGDVHGGQGVPSSACHAPPGASPVRAVRSAVANPAISVTRASRMVRAAAVGVGSRVRYAEDTGGAAWHQPVGRRRAVDPGNRSVAR